MPGHPAAHQASVAVDQLRPVGAIPEPGRSSRRWCWLALLGLGLALLAGPPAEVAAQRPATVAVIDLEGPIGPAATGYVTRSFAQARRAAADLIVLQIDTPGGLADAMRAIIQEILAAPVPVVGYVAPSGAHAASAGTYILYACHIAAMAPGTNLGAATPIRIDPAGSAEGAVEHKVLNDAIAFIRSLAELRGRNAEWAEQAVREAASLSAGDALRLNVIDLIAPDLPQLLARLDGRAVEAGGRSLTLQLADRQVLDLAPGWRTELLALVTNPTIAYILLLVGIYGLIFEFLTPGIVAPGVLGAICLLIALYAFQIIPVNYAGLGLILLAVLLMGLELTVPSFGALGLGGVAAFVIGSIMLMDTGVPGFDIPTELVGGVAVAASALLMALMLMLNRARTRPVVGGHEELLGGSAQIIEWTNGRGRVRMRGDTWSARGPEALSVGDRVRIVEIDGLTVQVEPEHEELRPG
jgi:membrane-bound serine protease (ClpP class)